MARALFLAILITLSAAISAGNLPAMPEPKVVSSGFMMTGTTPSTADAEAVDDQVFDLESPDEPSIDAAPINTLSVDSELDRPRRGGSRRGAPSPNSPRAGRVNVPCGEGVTTVSTGDIEWPVIFMSLDAPNKLNSRKEWAGLLVPRAEYDSQSSSFALSISCAPDVDDNKCKQLKPEGVNYLIVSASKQNIERTVQQHYVVWAENVKYGEEHEMQVPSAFPYSAGSACLSSVITNQSPGYAELNMQKPTSDTSPPRVFLSNSTLPRKTAEKVAFLCVQLDEKQPLRHRDISIDGFRVRAKVAEAINTTPRLSNMVQSSMMFGVGNSDRYLTVISDGGYVNTDGPFSPFHSHLKGVTKSRGSVVKVFGVVGKPEPENKARGDIRFLTLTYRARQ